MNSSYRPERVHCRGRNLGRAPGFVAGLQHAGFTMLLLGVGVRRHDRSLVTLACWSVLIFFRVHDSIWAGCCCGARTTTALAPHGHTDRAGSRIFPRSLILSPTCGSRRTVAATRRRWHCLCWWLMASKIWKAYERILNICAPGPACSCFESMNFSRSSRLFFLSALCVIARRVRPGWRNVARFHSGACRVPELAVSLP